MKILRTLLAVEGAGASFFHMDTIEYEGKFWLGPLWLEVPSEGYKRPAHIVCLDSLKHQKMIGSPLADFVLSGPLPKAAHEARAPQSPKPEYVLIENPPVHVPTPRGIH